MLRPRLTRKWHGALRAVDFELADLIKADLPRWQKVVTDAKIKID